MREFSFDVCLKGKKCIPDQGPSEWWGSGVYDEYVDEDRDAVITIVAESFESAKAILDSERFEWDDGVCADEYELYSWDDEGPSDEETEYIMDVDYSTTYGSYEPDPDRYRDDV